MNRFFKKVKNDNKGMTLLLAIVAVAFVGILAASIVSYISTNCGITNIIMNVITAIAKINTNDG